MVLITGPSISTRVIIRINFINLEFQMLHSKFQDHQTFGPDEIKF